MAPGDGVDERHLFPLTGVRIGLWKPRSAWSSFMLMLPASRKFVVLLIRHGSSKRRGHLGTIKDNVEHLLRHKNPFFVEGPAGVMAFEVTWSDVVGMDYMSRLMENTRLVLEARHLVKRVFATVEDACAHYLPGAPITPPNSPASARSGGRLSIDGQATEQISGSVTPSASSVRGGVDVPAWTEAGGQSGSLQRAQEGGGSVRATAAGLCINAPGGAFAAASQAAAGPAAAETVGRVSAAARATDGQGGVAAVCTPFTMAGLWPERDGTGLPSTCSPPLSTLRASASAVSIPMTASSDYGAAASQFPSRRSSMDSDLSAPMPSTPAALAAAQALLREAMLEPRGKGLSRASSMAQVQAGAALPAPRAVSGVPGVSAAAAATGSASAITLQPGLPSLEVSIGECIADCTLPPGMSAAHTQRGNTVSIDDSDIALLKLEPALSITSIVESATGTVNGDLPPLVAVPGLLEAHDRSSSRAASQRHVQLAGQDMQHELHSSQQMHQQPTQQDGGHGLVLVHRRRLHVQTPPQQQVVADQLHRNFHQQQLCNQQVPSGVTCGAGHAATLACSNTATSSKPRMPADAPNYHGKQRESCPLCNQVLGLPASSPRRSSLLGCTSPATSSSMVYRQPRASPVRPVRTSRRGGSAAAATAAAAQWEVAAGAAAGAAAAAALTGRPRLSLAQQRGLFHSVSADRSLSDVGGESSFQGRGGYRAANTAPGSDFDSPGVAEGGDGNPPTSRLQGREDAAAASSGDILLTAAQLAAGGGRGAYSCAFSCCTLVVTFTDPALPQLLSKLVKSDMRLLKHYESGLPAWAVVLPSYGLFYRPWMRRITWLLFVLVSVVSMALGFYDLYKNVPHFKSLVIRAFMPASYLFEWLELHTQMRLSILLTYLLGKSPLFMQVLRLVRNMAALAREALRPVWAMAAASVSTVAWVLQPVTSAAWAVLVALQQLLMALLWGPLQVLTMLRDALLPILSPIISSVAHAWATLRWGSGVARSVGGVARSVASEVPGVVSGVGAVKTSIWSLLSSWARLEALHLHQALVLRAVRSAQAIVRCWVTAVTTLNQHRVSLLLQMSQQARGLQRRAAGTRLGAGVLALVRPMLEAQQRRRQHQAGTTSTSAAADGSESAALSGAAAVDGVGEGGMDTGDAASEVDGSLADAGSEVGSSHVGFRGAASIGADRLSTDHISSTSDCESTGSVVSPESAGINDPLPSSLPSQKQQQHRVLQRSPTALQDQQHTKQRQQQKVIKEFLQSQQHQHSASGSVATSSVGLQVSQALEQQHNGEEEFRQAQQRQQWWRRQQQPHSPRSTGTAANGKPVATPKCPSVVTDAAPVRGAPAIMATQHEPSGAQVHVVRKRLGIPSKVKHLAIVAGAPSPRPSSTDGSQGSAWDRAAHRLQGIKWLRTPIKSHPE